MDPDFSMKNRLSMERNFKLYLHSEIAKFENDFNKFLSCKDNVLELKSDEKVYLHTVYKFLREAFHFTQEETNIYLDHCHMPKMEDDIIPDMISRSGIDFKVKIERDKSYSPPLVKMTFNKILN